MRLLVCGGRDYRDWAKVCAALGAVSRKHKIDCIIHGAAGGADTLAGEWAKDNGILVLAFQADWAEHGKAAGPRRNQRMLDEAKPNAVVAFPGGRGTADMVSRAKAASIPVWEIES